MASCSLMTGLTWSISSATRTSAWLSPRPASTQHHQHVEHVGKGELDFFLPRLEPPSHIKRRTDPPDGPEPEDAQMTCVADETPSSGRR